MKNMRKILSLALVLVMILGLSVTAFAAGGQGGENASNGKITVTAANVDETYTIYRIFDLVSYDTEAENNGVTGVYSYKLSEKWAGFTNTAFFTINDNGYVELVESADAEAFAEAAIAYATTNSIVHDGTDVAEADTVEFTGLKLGYYLVDTTMGSICSLNTTNPEVEIADKHVDPSLTKTVEEDSTNEYDAENTADINQVVNFKVNVTLQPGTQNITLHDQLTSGLTLNPDTITVKVNGTALTVGTDYTITAANQTENSKDDITIVFAEVDDETVVEVAYNANLNETATVGTEGNATSAWLTYAADQKTAEVSTNTETYAFNFTKVKEDNTTALAGAEFVLTNKTSGKYAKFDQVEAAGEKAAYYRFDSWVDTKDEATTLISDENGKVYIEGFDVDTYNLEETKAPNGYNLLKDTKDFQIGAEGAYEAFNIVNVAGTLLPSTGGMGTTLFYTLGAILVLGAAVLLITKRRMSVN